MAVATERPPVRRESPKAPAPWPEAIWTPFSVSLLLLVLGLWSIVVGRLLLFPSLAPAAVIQADLPFSKAARPWNTLAGQFIAIAGAYFAVWLTGAASSAPSLQVGYLSAPRLGATVIAAAITLLGQVAARAVDPPAAATVLLITFGGFSPVPRDYGSLIGGVLITAFLGECLRRWRLAQLLGPPR